MELTNEQKKTVAGWVSNGEGLSEIQRKLVSEFNVKMTFMEVRFLVDDLGVKLKNKQVSQSKSPSISPAKAPEADSEAELPDEDEKAAFEEPEPANADGVLPNISVEIDMVTKPGTVVSGTVVFSDGVKASWALDTYGRLALSAGKGGYKPGPADIRAFQQELGKQLKKRGF